jgi:hypothetical protein
MFKRKHDSEPTVAKMKEYEVVVDYCANMVAIAIVRHMVDVNNVNVQWSACQLEQSLNESTLGKNPDFYCDGLALSHGFLMFRKDLVRHGLSVIEIFQEDKCVPCFHDMKFSRMSIEIKFNSYRVPDLVEVDLLSSIVLLRNDILRRNKYEPSPYYSPSLVFGVMQINRIKNRSTRDMGTNTPSTSANLRKSPSDLTERSIKNVTAKVITSVEGVVGEKNSLYFLKSAVKILDFNNRKCSNEEEEDGDSDTENNENDISLDNVEYEEYEIDERLRTVINNIPGKNIVFSSYDIENVLNVFDVVRIIESEKNTTNIINKSATITVNMLSEHTYYSQLSTRSVLRWNRTRDKIYTTPGRKIDTCFESEVWGKLMLCVFERSSNNVSLLISLYIFIVHFTFHLFISLYILTRMYVYTC